MRPDLSQPRTPAILGWGLLGGHSRFWFSFSGNSPPSPSIHGRAAGTVRPADRGRASPTDSAKTGDDTPSNPITLHVLGHGLLPLCPHFILGLPPTQIRFGWRGLVRRPGRLRPHPHSSVSHCPFLRCRLHQQGSQAFCTLDPKVSSDSRERTGTLDFGPEGLTCPHLAPLLVQPTKSGRQDSNPHNRDHTPGLFQLSYVLVDTEGLEPSSWSRAFAGLTRQSSQVVPLVVTSCLGKPA